MTPTEFLADLHAKAQAQRFEPAIPVGETADSDWGSLLEEPIREMLTGALRARRAKGETVVSLAASFGIHHATVSRIARRVWRTEVSL